MSVSVGVFAKVWQKNRTHNRVPTHFEIPFSILLQYLSNTNLKDFNTIIYLHFLKIVLTEHNAQNICRLSSAVKNNIRINKWLNLEIVHLFNTYVHFGKSLLFHGLANRFHNSILSIARGSLVTRILGFSLVLQTSGFASIAVARR